MDELSTKWVKLVLENPPEQFNRFRNLHSYLQDTLGLESFNYSIQGQLERGGIPLLISAPYAEGFVTHKWPFPDCHVTYKESRRQLEARSVVIRNVPLKFSLENFEDVLGEDLETIERWNYKGQPSKTIMVRFKTRAARNQALNQGVRIPDAHISFRAEPLFNTRSLFCKVCKTFFMEGVVKHSPSKCKRVRCGLCGDSHPTKSHPPEIKTRRCVCCDKEGHTVFDCPLGANFKRGIKDQKRKKLVPQSSRIAVGPPTGPAQLPYPALRSSNRRGPISSSAPPVQNQALPTPTGGSSFPAPVTTRSVLEIPAISFLMEELDEKDRKVIKTLLAALISLGLLDVSRMAALNPHGGSSSQSVSQSYAAVVANPIPPPPIPAVGSTTFGDGHLTRAAPASFLQAAPFVPPTSAAAKAVSFSIPLTNTAGDDPVVQSPSTHLMGATAPPHKRRSIYKKKRRAEDQSPVERVSPAAQDLTAAQEDAPAQASYKYPMHKPVPCKSCGKLVAANAMHSHRNSKKCILSKEQPATFLKPSSSLPSGMKTVAAPGQESTNRNKPK